MPMTDFVMSCFLTHLLYDIVKRFLVLVTTTGKGNECVTYSVVWLRFADAAAFGPVVLLAVGGGSQLLQLGGPEPSVHLVREQVWTVASFEVAEATRCPNVFLLRETNKNKNSNYLRLSLMVLS